MKFNLDICSQVCNNSVNVGKRKSFKYRKYHFDNSVNTFFIQNRFITTTVCCIVNKVLITRPNTAKNEKFDNILKMKSEDVIRRTENAIARMATQKTKD